MASLLFLDGSMERKLSTILALDVVGFSALMANDEDITLANLRQRRELIDGIIHEYDGRIFGSAGDSIIAEFSSPVKATECGVKIQTKMQAINKKLETILGEKFIDPYNVICVNNSCRVKRQDEVILFYDGFHLT